MLLISAENALGRCSPRLAWSTEGREKRSPGQPGRGCFCRTMEGLPVEPPRPSLPFSKGQRNEPGSRHHSWMDERAPRMTQNGHRLFNEAFAQKDFQNDEMSERGHAASTEFNHGQLPRAVSHQPCHLVHHWTNAGQAPLLEPARVSHTAQLAELQDGHGSQPPQARVTGTRARATGTRARAWGHGPGRGGTGQGMGALWKLRASIWHCEPCARHCSGCSAGKHPPHVPNHLHVAEDSPGLEELGGPQEVAERTGGHLTPTRDAREAV